MESGKPNDVKRCYLMKDALNFLDFNDESIEHLKMMLLRASFSPQFLRSAYGRRFIAHLFTIRSGTGDRINSFLLKRHYNISRYKGLESMFLVFDFQAI